MFVFISNTFSCLKLLIFYLNLIMADRAKRPRRYCRFLDCDTRDVDGTRMHRFPRDEIRSKLWLSTCNNKKLEKYSTETLCSNVYVCNRHFQDWCFSNIRTKIRLVHNAVPGQDKDSAILQLKILKESIKVENDENSDFMDNVINNNKKRRCYEDGGKTTLWTNDMDENSPNDAQEQDSVCDAQSICSVDTIGTNASYSVELPDVKARMRKLFESQSFTDVTFYPKNNRKVSISAHRSVLAISSPLFAKMLFGEHNKINVGEKLDVQISNLSFDAFTSIVKYLYTDEISFDNDAIVHSILEGAKQFDIPSLVYKCNKYFENLTVTCDNVCSKFQMSLSNKITLLKEKCIELIQRKTLSVIQSADFQKCSSTTIRAICKLQSLNLRSEMELFEALMKWLNNQPKFERKSNLECLQKCIRFLNLTVNEMTIALEKYPDIMMKDEALRIMMFLGNLRKNLSFKAVPAWCNKSMQSRCFYNQDEYDDVQKDSIVGKVFFPLKPDLGQGFISELTSLLQMKCLSGFHTIKAIRLQFEKPMSDKCRINNLSIKVHVSPSGFEATENVQIVNSESVRIQFKRVIKVRRGDTLDIEAMARNIELYKFLQYDETYPIPTNPNFSILLSCLPKQGKLYFISEIEYEPQYKLGFKHFKNKNKRK